MRVTGAAKPETREVSRTLKQTVMSILGCRLDYITSEID